MNRNNVPTRFASPATENARPESHQLVDHFFRSEYARLVATLTRRFGASHWERVEDVVQSALERALIAWPRRGIPANPSAWLYRVASNLAIDSLRRDARKKSLDDSTGPSTAETASPAGSGAALELEPDDSQVHDDLLRMIFVCCHPQVPPESQIALALKTLCGFGNLEIARALLTTGASVAKRITRAKQRLRELKIEPSALTQETFRERLPDVQAVIYSLFNEGYSSSLADKLIREELCEEAVRMALVLAEHPSTAGAESSALLSLLLFHAARLDARIAPDGAMLVLKEQDRSRWDQRLMSAAFDWFRRAANTDRLTRYHAEAWIASEHCRAASLETTDWDRIVTGYDLLCRLSPSPVHELNRAIAIGRRDGAAAGLAAFETLDAESLPDNYYLWHATRGELARQTGDLVIARTSLQQAWKLAPTNSEKELICRKLDAMDRSEDA